MMYFLELVKFFLFNRAPFHSLDFLFARGRANPKLAGVDGSRIMMFSVVISVWFYWIFVIFRIFLMLI